MLVIPKYLSAGKDLFWLAFGSSAVIPSRNVLVVQVCNDSRYFLNYKICL